MTSRMLCGLCLLLATCASTPHVPSYLDRFAQYISWSKHLPEKPSPLFIEFIQEDTPLARKLREKWLFSLAKQKEWGLYSAYYQPSKSKSLQCYAQYALYQTEQQKEAIDASKILWLTGDELPLACDLLFKRLIADHVIDDDLILERVRLALEKRHVALAKYLVTLAKLEDPHEKRTLELIHKRPTRITNLSPSSLHSHYYLYGLKRLISSNPKHAIELWENAKTKKILNSKQEQAFLSHLALYQAIRNKPDAADWFKQIKPDAYNETLLDWQIRFSLRHHEWQRVKALIALSEKREEPGWQYWLARAEEAEGHLDAAHEIYETLAKQRHYYGFLASVRLKQPMAFEEEVTTESPELLAHYEPIIEQIKQLYAAHKHTEASRMANDFSSELPKTHKSAFVAWVANVLHWTGKSVYLSGDKALNDQLSLRFPIAHKSIIQNYAKQYDLPEALVYAVIRQESAFRHDVTSPVGAHGLMQLMPKTAKHIARKQHIAYRDTRDLFIPEKNISLGVAYLAYLAKKFDHNPALMIAAYNAGPHQVKRWIRAYPTQEIDIWVDTLPFGETRNYIKAVIAFYAVYQHRLNQKPNLNAFIKQDLNHNNRHKDLKTASQSTP